MLNIYIFLNSLQEAATIEEANVAIGEAAYSLSIIGSLRHVTKMEDKDSQFTLL